MAHVSVPFVWALPDVVAHTGGPVAVIGDDDGSSDEKPIGVPDKAEEDAPDDSEEASDGVVVGFVSHSGRTNAIVNNAMAQKNATPKMMTHV